MTVFMGTCRRTGRAAGGGGCHLSSVYLLSIIVRVDGGIVQFFVNFEPVGLVDTALDIQKVTL
jgi:hypothetical protein